MAKISAAQPARASDQSSASLPGSCPFEPANKTADEILEKAESRPTGGGWWLYPRPIGEDLYETDPPDRITRFSLRWFATKDEAKKFLEDPRHMDAYKELPVPSVTPEESVSRQPILKFRDYLPVEKAQGVRRIDHARGNQLRRKGFDPMSVAYVLSDQWDWEDIRHRAIRQPSSARHFVAGEPVEDPTRLLRDALCDLEVALDGVHPRLSTDSRRAFFQSWQVFKYLLDVCRDLVWDRGLDANNVEGARDFTWEQLFLYTSTAIANSRQDVAERRIDKEKDIIQDRVNSSGHSSQELSAPLNAKRRKRGRPPIPEDRKRRALEARKEGKKGKDVAAILYKTPHPSRNQQSDALKTIKRYEAKLPGGGANAR